MKLLYGISNAAKVNAMQSILIPLGIELYSLSDIKQKLPVVIENGKTPQDNARIKAIAYYNAFHIPVFTVIQVYILKICQRSYNQKQM